MRGGGPIDGYRPDPRVRRGASRSRLLGDAARAARRKAGFRGRTSVATPSDDRTRSAKHVPTLRCTKTRGECRCGGVHPSRHARSSLARFGTLPRRPGRARRVLLESSKAPTATLVRRYTCGSDVLRPLLCTPHLVPPSRVGATCTMGFSAGARRGCRGAADGERRPFRALPWT
jgi:hypothetical protein